MPKKNSKTKKRGLRADAQRNCERLLEAAKEVFTRDGANASLDEIARQAGVGAGTLYRHFPTRDALIAAVYHAEVEKLAAAGPKFTEKLKPVEALRAWMLLFVDYIAAKQIIAPALNSVAGGAEKLYEGSKSKVHGTLDALVRRAIKSGELRKDVEAIDFLRAMIGVAYVGQSEGWKASAKRMVEMLVEGARVR